jgi:hypothetical protein
MGVPLLLVLAATSIGGFVVAWRFLSKRAAATKPDLDAMLAEAWTATVSRREYDEVATGGQFANAKHKTLTVYYVRDDSGEEGAIVQYEGNAMDSMYNLSPGLEFYRHAPRYEELEGWREGDRLEKSAGDYFPHKVG